MDLLIAVPAAWILLAVLVGLLVGRGIRLESGPDPTWPAAPDAPTEPATTSSDAPAGGARSTADDWQTTRCHPARMTAATL